MRYPAVRFSFGKNQTKSDIDEAIAILRQTWGSGAKK
jgi:cysteine sulfinate desulfinase/cysteine desulfurase-like protein